MQKIAKIKTPKKEIMGMYSVFSSHKKDVDIYVNAARDSALVSQFKRKLKDQTYKIVPHLCPICKSDDYTLVAESIEGFKWGICKSCGLLQIYCRFGKYDLVEFYKTGEYNAIGMGGIKDNTLFTLENKVMSLYFIDIFKRLNMHSGDISVVEIGCGSGGILHALKEWGVKAVKGYDIDEQRVNYGKTIVPELEVSDAMSDDFEIDDRFNLVMLSNIIEHLYDPQEFMARIAQKIISPDVKVVIDIPNLEYCYRYSDISFLRFLCIQHLWYFSSITIERLVNQAGFGVDHIFPRGASFTIICSKRSEPVSNNNNGYWNSVSSINYANYCCDPNNISVEANRRTKLYIAKISGNYKKPNHSMMVDN